jgi:hypothetical protein
MMQLESFATSRWYFWKPYTPLADAMTICNDGQVAGLLAATEFPDNNSHRLG